MSSTTEMMTVSDVMQDLKVAASTVYSMLRAKKDPLPHVKLGTKSYRIPVREYREWLERKLTK